MEKITELDLDIPYHPLAAYAISWGEARRNFWNITRCVVSLVEKCMEPIPNDRFWKVIVNCVDIPLFENGDIRNTGGGTVEIDIPFDYPNFLAQNREQQKKATLALLCSGVTLALKQLGVENNKFVCACEKAQLLKLENKWVHKRVRYLKTPYVAEIWCVHEVNHMYIFLSVFYEDEEIEKHLIADVIPDEWIFKPMLGEVKWKNKSEVVLYSKDKKSMIKTVVRVT